MAKKPFEANKAALDAVEEALAIDFADDGFDRASAQTNDGAQQTQQALRDRQRLPDARQNRGDDDHLAAGGKHHEPERHQDQIRVGFIFGHRSPRYFREKGIS